MRLPSSPSTLCQPGSIRGGVLALVIAVTACQSQEPDPLSQQRSALKALYDATGGDDWAQSDNWLSDRPLEDWYGISTNADGYVDSIYLAGNELSGSIPAELGELDSLKYLHLGDVRSIIDAGSNYLSSIPAELGSLGNLKYLDLSRNSRLSSIPAELGNLGSLVWLDLTGTGLTSIPAELGNLANLERLYLTGTGLTSIPAELGNLANLKWLNLASSRDLVGPLPTELVRIQNLRVLRFHDTSLCAPTDPDFKDWLEGLESWSGNLCD